MKAVVTGATGFIGSHVAERLVGEGLDVVCLVRPTSNLAWLEGLSVERRVAPLEDAEALAEAVADAEYVFHAAGLTRARSARAYRAVNTDGTRRLLEAVERSGAELRRFVYVSSLAAAGPSRSPEPLKETDEPQPIDGYGASKLAAEHIVLGQAEHVPATIVRPPAVYGPRDGNFLPLFRSAQRWGLAPVIGGPAKEATFAHVADLVQGLWLAASAQAAVGRIYFIGSGTHTVGEVVHALAAALRRPLRRLRVPGLLARLIGELGELKWTLTGRPQIISRRKVRDMLQARWTCSWARAERELGYHPQLGLEEGLRQTAEWYARAGWLKPLPQG